MALVIGSVGEICYISIAIWMKLEVLLGSWASPT